jgi:hypothetical protein
MPFLFDVDVAMMHPIRARAGDVLVVRPGHATRAVVVMRDDGAAGWQPVVVASADYGALVALEGAGVIRSQCCGGALAKDVLALSE